MRESLFSIIGQNCWKKAAAMQKVKRFLDFNRYTVHGESIECFSFVIHKKKWPTVQWIFFITVLSRMFLFSFPDFYPGVGEHGFDLVALYNFQSEKVEKIII